MIERLLIKNFNILASKTAQISSFTADAEAIIALIGFLLKNLYRIFKLQKIVYESSGYQDEDDGLAADINLRIDAMFLALEDGLRIVNQLIEHNNEHLVIDNLVMSIQNEIYSYEEELASGFLTNKIDVIHIEAIIEEKLEFLSFLKTLNIFSRISENKARLFQIIPIDPQLCSCGGYISKP